MNTIDWSKAPEEFDVHIKWSDGHGEFYKEKEFMFVRDGGKYAFKHDVAEMGVAVSRRPWNGEGLPPAGIDVEFSVAGDTRWIEGEVLYSSLYTVVISENGFEHVHHPKALKFRPIRTPEQIAAEERLHEIRNACTAISNALSRFHESEEPTSISIIEAMIDEGYRKQDAK